MSPTGYVGPVPERWTIRRLIDWTSSDFAARGIESARLDAEILLANVLGIERVGLYLDLDRPMSSPELEAYRAVVLRRRRREPVAYIVGSRAFYGRLFSVSPAVLVPRPDTETLVEVALELLPETSAEPDRRIRVADIGTGSGAIGLTLAAERPAIDVVATDVSTDALAVAEGNAVALGLNERVELRQGDLVEPLRPLAPFDVVLSNPPYIAEAELADLMPEVSVHEPKLALVAADAGLAVHRRLIEAAPGVLRPGGWLLLEIGSTQAEAVRSAFQRAGGWSAISIRRDLGGLDRVISAQRA